MSDIAAVVRRFVADYQSAGNENVAEELLSAGFVDHTPFPGFGSTREDVKRLFHTLRAAFPDLHAEIHEQLSHAGRVATCKTFHGTHLGSFLGLPPTGKTVSIRVIDIVRVESGRIAEHWNVVDVEGLMRQLQS